jgi:hypothetical protein
MKTSGDLKIKSPTYVMKVSDGRRETLRRTYGYSAIEIRSRAKEKKITIDELYQELLEEHEKYKGSTSAYQRKIVRTFYKKTPNDLKEEAKAKSTSLDKLYHDLLYNYKTQKNLVRAEWRWWTKVDPIRKADLKEKTFKTFGSTEYFNRWNNISFTVPKELARTWEANEISDLIDRLKELGPNYQDLWEALEKMVSDDIVLELVSAEPIHTYEGEVTGLKHTPHRNGTRKICSKFIHHPIHEYFQGSLEKQYLTLPFEKKGACGPNAILNEFALQWNAFYKKDKSKLTYEKIEELVKKACDRGLTWEDLKPVFIFLGCKAKLFTISGRLIDSHEPEKINRHVQKSLCLVAHDGHFYWVFDPSDKKSLIQSEERPSKLSATTHYPDVSIREGFDGIVRSLDEAAEKALATREKNLSRFIWRGGLLEDAVRDLINMGVDPGIHMNTLDVVMSVTFPLGEKNVCCMIVESDGLLTDEQLLKHVELHEETMKVCLDKKHISRYSESVQTLLREFRGAPQRGLYKETDLKTLVGLDQVKCFSYHLYKQEHIPLFTAFDEFRPYDGHTIEPLTLYHTRGNVSYGFALEQRPISFVRPSRLKKNPFREQIKKVLECPDLPIESRKFILNSVIGWLGKTRNKKRRTSLFKEEMEAERKRLEIGALEIKPFLDWFLVTDSSEAELDEGFLAIHKMVYDSVAVHIRNFKAELESKGLDVIGVKADCLLVSEKDAKKVDYPFSYAHTVETMGLIKKESPSENTLKLIRPPSSELRRPKKSAFTTRHTLKNEWDVTEAFALFEKGGNWVITADDAGSGKTHIVKEYFKTKENTAIACFSNEQATVFRKEGLMALTVYSLMDAKPGDEFSKGSTSNEYSKVLFDELGMHNSSTRTMILRYMRANPQIQFFATEDLSQIPPIEGDGWVAEKSWYNRSTATMFPMGIHLEIPKRFPQHQHAKVKSIRKNPLAHLKDWQKGPLQWKEGDLCLSYTHKTRHHVNALIHGDKEYFLVDQVYICMNPAIFKKQCAYTLKKITDTKLTFEDVLDGTSHVIDRVSRKGHDMLTKENFSLPYCRTGHVCQGKSCDGSVFVFDSHLPFVEKEWIYVALTRARDLDNVWLVDGGDVPKMDPREISSKLEGYKQQDIKAGRPPGNLEIQDILEANHHCGKCGELMNFVNTKGSHHNWSVDRLRNNESHNKDNFQLTCIHCNISRD